MVGYGIRYRLDFCDVFGVKKRIDILKRGYTDRVITPFVGSGNPISIAYKDSDNKFNQITESEAIVRIISSPLIDLNTFYSDDETTWLVKLYSGDFVGNVWNDLLKWDDIITWEDFTPNEGTELSWCGFLRPEKTGEPFQSTFPFQIKASDMLSTLNNVPYANNTALIKKVDSYKNILIECLNRTGLRLNTIIATDVFESSMAWASDLDCSLEQTYIDTNRFIDGNNKPYSCYDIITHICNEFTANVSHVNGKWHFIDRTMFIKNTFVGVEFTPETSKVGTVTINALKQIVPENIVNADMIIAKEPGYKIVTAYYQYGYLSNKLQNGDFNIVNPLPMTQRFPHWHEFGGLVLGYGQKSVNTGSGTVLIDDYYAVLENKGLDKGFTSDPVSALTTNTIAVSVFVKRFDSSGSGTDFFRLNMRLTLTGIGQPTYYWSGNANKWVQAETSSEDTFVQVRVDTNSMINGSSVGFDAGYPVYDGAVTVTIFGVEDKNENARKTIIEDVSIKVDESQYYKSSIGEVTQLTNFGEYSKSPDPLVLLFGDDANKNRTSWMRNASGVPTLSWFKKGNQNYPAMQLKDVVARNILTQHQKPTRRIDGSFLGEFTPLNALSIPLLIGKFMFLSGTFDVKSATAKLVLAEVFTNNFTGFRSDVFLDKGDFKDTKGSNVGSSSGINLTPVQSQTSGTVNEIGLTVPAGLQVSPDAITQDGTFAITLQEGYVIPKAIDIPGKASEAETGDGINDTKFITPSKLALWWNTLRTTTRDISGIWKFSNGLTIVVQEYPDNQAAITAGLTAGSVYRTGDTLKIVY